jgi:hypothetical protein
VDVGKTAKNRRLIETIYHKDRLRKEKKMAHIDEANFGGHIRIHTNISDVVGIGRNNEKSDVMLIQALFKLVGLGDGNSSTFFGMDSRQLPGITGVLDHETSQAIWAFQRKSSSSLLSVDGTVHPASYKHRVIKNGRADRLMTITFLNQLALMEARSTFGLDLITALKATAPQLFLKPYDPSA